MFAVVARMQGKPVHELSVILSKIPNLSCSVVARIRYELSGLISMPRRYIILHTFPAAVFD